MGVALPRPSGWPNIAEKILNFFIDHKQLDGDFFVVKIPNFNFCQNMGVVLSLPSVWLNFFGIIFLIFLLDTKLHDTKGILITNWKRKTYKSRRWQAPGAVKKKKNRKKIFKKSEKKSKRSCQCLYMFLSTQSKKPNLRRRLNHVPIN